MVVIVSLSILLMAACLPTGYTETTSVLLLEGVSVAQQS